MPFIRCEQEVSYCCRLQFAIDSKMNVEDEDPHLRCCLFDKLYTSHYLMHGGLHRKYTLEIKVLQCRDVRKSLLTGWALLKLFAVPVKERHCY